MGDIRDPPQPVFDISVAMETLECRLSLQSNWLFLKTASGKLLFLNPQKDAKA